MLLRSMLQSVTVLTGIVKRWVPPFEESECLFACQCGSACGLRHDVAGSRRVGAGSRSCSGSADLLRTFTCLPKVRRGVWAGTMCRRHIGRYKDCLVHVIATRLERSVPRTE